MIQKQCFGAEWIDRVAKELSYNDKGLIEKVIRALSLLELLALSDCPFVFKGGTALMLVLKEAAHRLSIDVDIVCPPGTDIEKYLKAFSDFGFVGVELVERKQRNGLGVPKSHSKFFYQVAYQTGGNARSYILLDVLYEDVRYCDVRRVAIDSPFVLLEGKSLSVAVPSVEDLLGDKLTAFAPNTTGIPYYKNDRVCSMEIIKQLYDVGRLFERVSDLRVTGEAFRRIAAVELDYRSLADGVRQVFEDIRQTALCLSTRGKEGFGRFELLQDGIMRIKPFMYKRHYYIEHAIADASKAAYLATLLENGKSVIERYSGNPLEVKDMLIRSVLPNKLNKLKVNLPEAYYYWVKTSELL